MAASVSAGFDYNSSSSISTLNESSSTLGSSTGIKIVKPAFANPGQYAYAAQTYIFGQQAPAGTVQQIPLSTTVKSGGPLWTAFVADPTDTANGAGAWWAQAYTRPDVALNHPSRWNWTPPPAERRRRDLQRGQPQQSRGQRVLLDEGAVHHPGRRQRARITDRAGHGGRRHFPSGPRVQLQPRGHAAGLDRARALLRPAVGQGHG